MEKTFQNRLKYEKSFTAHHNKQIKITLHRNVIINKRCYEVRTERSGV